MRPVLRLLLLVGTVLVALAGCASKPDPQATAGGSTPGTKAVTFHAFDRDGQLTVQVADVVRGQCWTTSVAAPAADAYRCFQGDKILDPCFAPAHATAPVELACLAAPWSRAVMLQVSGQLPKPAHTGATARPWAFELDNGARCVASTGTVPAVAGVNLGYHCTDGGDAALTSPGGSSLTAQYAVAGAKSLQRTAVTTVWRT